VRQTDADQVTLVGAGITLHEAMKAADELASDGIAARVIDCYSIKPIDATTLRTAGRETGAILTVEDHWPEGGLGDAVLEVFAGDEEHPPIVNLAVRHMPGSATPAEQLALAGIDAGHIAAAAHELATRRSIPHLEESRP
jgi:transketolase